MFSHLLDFITFQLFHSHLLNMISAEEGGSANSARFRVLLCANVGDDETGYEWAVERGSWSRDLVDF